jgi:predicted transcriptional regulator
VEASKSKLTMQLDQETESRLNRRASAKGQSPEAILHKALSQYLTREENQGTKNYPRRHPVGGIITPV